MTAALHDDIRWIEAAARLGERGRPLSAPNPAVGCIIVRDGRVIARGWTQEGGRPHAEAQALADLAEIGQSAANSEIYVSLEPCAHQSERGPSCAETLAKAAPARIIIGLLDPDPRTSGKGVERLRSAGIAVDVLDSKTASQSLAGYLSQAQKQRPFITLKLAMSADGFIAREPGQEQWITGEEARAHVHARRAKQDAILVGGATWRADNPRLDVRLEGLENRSPTRFVLTQRYPLDKARWIETPQDVHQLSAFQSLYIEGGAKVASAFFEAGLIDRIELYIAPVKIGSGVKAPACILPEALDGWEIAETCQLGSDRFTAYQRIETIHAA